MATTHAPTIVAVNIVVSLFVTGVTGHSNGKDLKGHPFVKILSVSKNPRLNMCLWYVQYCPGCCVFTPMPNTLPQYCDNAECLRKTLNPNFLTEEEKEDFLGYDYPCNKHCSRQKCGLLIRYCYCGDLNAIRDDCLESDGEDGEDSTPTDSDDENPAQHIVTCTI
jgi:hypothetical protein